MKRFLLFYVALFFIFPVKAELSRYKISDEILDQYFLSATEYSFEEISVNDIQDSTIKVKDRATAGVLGLFLGALGIHRLYSGSPFQVWGLYAGITLLPILCGSSITLVGCPIGPAIIPLSAVPAIVGIIDAIIIFTDSDEDYQSQWVGSTKIFNW